MTELNRGLDLSNLDDISETEAAAFRAFYEQSIGVVHKGFDFWINEDRPDVLKKYRNYADLPAPGAMEDGNPEFCGFGFLQYYALSGYDVGVRYLVWIYQQMGMTKSGVLEGLALAFLHAGPRGMETMAIALEDFPWIEPERGLVFPAGWAPDPAAFHTGVDLSTRQVLPGEMERLISWYRDVLGEVPRYVTMMARHRPDILKAWRNRYESILVELPKQVMPYSLLHYNVIRGSAAGIRENVLLCRAFGVSKGHTLQAIFSAMLNGGPETIDLVEEAAGDVLAEEWANP